MNFSLSLYILTFALLYELYVPFPAAEIDTSTISPTTENFTETTTTTPKTRRTRTTRARYTFDGVDYHEFLGKYTKTTNMDCSTRFLKCYLYTPLHWEACMFDDYNSHFYDVFSVCQIDFMNCWETRLRKRPYVGYEWNYRSFQGYGHRCKMSRGKLKMGP